MNIDDLCPKCGELGLREDCVRGDLVEVCMSSPVCYRHECIYCGHITWLKQVICRSKGEQTWNKSFYQTDVK